MWLKNMYKKIIKFEQIQRFHDTLIHFVVKFIRIFGFSSNRLFLERLNEI